MLEDDFREPAESCPTKRRRPYLGTHRITQMLHTRPQKSKQKTQKQIVNKVFIKLKKRKFPRYIYLISQVAVRS